ncbi:hypothetical protein SDC9_47515 [bioreactor metagenome]|uniref:TonB C-terminal domain-containing protein n=1 Tax=bioreactor metagenome TaxID=1076179 RepID=A0A644WBS2_9ZZZZ
MKVLFSVFYVLLAWPVLSQNNSESCKPYSVVSQDSIIYLLTDSMPEFVGGTDSLFSFFNKNINLSGEEECYGTVFISFIVQSDGNISSAEVLKGICEKYDSEALRLILTMPAWIPGSCNGKKVPVRLVLPVRFKLY